VRVGGAGTDAGNVCPVGVTVPTTLPTELTAEICTWFACNNERDLREAIGAFVNEDTVHVTDGFVDTVQTSTELVISSVLSVDNEAENDERLTASTVTDPTAGTST